MFINMSSIKQQVTRNANTDKTYKNDLELITDQGCDDRQSKIMRCTHAYFRVMCSKKSEEIVIDILIILPFATVICVARTNNI